MMRARPGSTPASAAESALVKVRVAAPDQVLVAVPLTGMGSQHVHAVSTVMSVPAALAAAAHLLAGLDVMVRVAAM